MTQSFCIFLNAKRLDYKSVKWLGRCVTEWLYIIIAVWVRDGAIIRLDIKMSDWWCMDIYCTLNIHAMRYIQIWQCANLPISNTKLSHSLFAGKFIEFQVYNKCRVGLRWMKHRFGPFPELWSIFLSVIITFNTL